MLPPSVVTVSLTCTRNNSELISLTWFHIGLKPIECVSSQAAKMKKKTYNARQGDRCDSQGAH